MIYGKRKRQFLMFLHQFHLTEENFKVTFRPQLAVYAVKLWLHHSFAQFHFVFLIASQSYLPFVFTLFMRIL